MAVHSLHCCLLETVAWTGDWTRADFLVARILMHGLTIQLQLIEDTWLFPHVNTAYTIFSLKLL